MLHAGNFMEVIPGTVFFVRSGNVKILSLSCATFI